MTVRHLSGTAGRIAVLLTVAILGALFGRAIAAPQSNTQGDAVAEPRATRAGAVAAATQYLGALRWNVLVDDQRRLRVIERHATPEAVSQLDAELAVLAEGLRAAVTDPPVVARSTVLGYRVGSFSERRAVVTVWGMALFGTGAYEPATQWSTSTLELTWSGGRWLVAAVTSRGGPSPGSRVGTLASAARRFREVRHVP